ncbi:MAG: phosphatase PAP2 family protein [Bacteroidales bacterium]|nr:phosphatase PAP2 family protein [Bacteroidales bacterium]
MALYPTMQSKFIAFCFFFSSIFVKRTDFYTTCILIWAVLVSYSRIYLGVHYPLDVIGGAIFGTIFSFLIVYLVNISIRTYYKT